MPRPQSLSLELLQTFVRLRENGGDAGRTAKDLGINQPSMSKRLKYLQHAGVLLGRPWLVREGKAWCLTDEGRRVLPAVQEIVKRYDKLTQFVARPEGTRVCFACGQLAIRSFVRRAVQRFRRRYPDVTLHVSTPRGTARIEGVANGLLDLATVTHGRAEIHEIARRPLHVECLTKDAMVLVCSANTQWADGVRKLPKTKTAASALTGFPLILPDAESGIRHWLDQIFREEGLMPNLSIVMETGGWETILGYVRDGFGVGIVSEAAVGGETRLVVRRLDPSVFPHRETKLICRPAHTAGQKLDLTAEAEAFRQALLAATR
jgi:DNA-binding transcriptional LysR family regulator